MAVHPLVFIPVVSQSQKRKAWARAGCRSMARWRRVPVQVDGDGDDGCVGQEEGGDRLLPEVETENSVKTLESRPAWILHPACCFGNDRPPRPRGPLDGPRELYCSRGRISNPEHFREQPKTARPSCGLRRGSAPCDSTHGERRMCLIRVAIRAGEAGPAARNPGLKPRPPPPRRAPPPAVVRPNPRRVNPGPETPVRRGKAHRDLRTESRE